MYRNLIYSSSMADDRDISEAENRIGGKLPNSYVSFCRQHDGAKLKNAKTSALKGREYEIMK